MRYSGFIALPLYTIESSREVARDAQPVRYCMSLIYEATVSFFESTGKKKTNGMCVSRENNVIGDQHLGLVTQENVCEQ